MKLHIEEFWRTACPDLQLPLWETAIEFIACMEKDGFLVEACICFQDAMGRQNEWRYSQHDSSGRESTRCVSDDDAGCMPFWTLDLILHQGVPFECFNRFLESFPKGAFHLPGVVVRGGSCYDYLNQCHLELMVVMAREDDCTLCS